MDYKKRKEGRTSGAGADESWEDQSSPQRLWREVVPIQEERSFTSSPGVIDNIPDDGCGTYFRP